MKIMVFNLEINVNGVCNARITFNTNQNRKKCQDEVFISRVFKLTHLWVQNLFEGKLS